MFIRRKELANIADEKVYPIDIVEIKMENNPYLKRLENVKGDLTFYYDINDKLNIDYMLHGKMICPDPMTLEDVYVDFDLNEIELVTFDENQEGFFMGEDMDDSKLVLNIVLPEVPISVENGNKKVYYYGDDWSLMSEEEYESRQKDKIDPRLAKLLEYKEED